MKISNQFRATNFEIIKARYDALWENLITISLKYKSLLFIVENTMKTQGIHFEVNKAPL